MTNDERIKRWREERAGRPAAVSVESDELTAASTAGSGRTGARSAGSSESGAGMPNELSLAEARAAVLQRRRLRWQRLVRRTALFVAMPLFVFLAYAWLIATPLYQGEAVFTVQTSSDSQPAAIGGILGIGSSSAAISDAFKAREFILSRPMMEQLERRHKFLSHFESYQMDPLQRLHGPLGLHSDSFDYYRKRVRVAVDVQEGILKLYVQARTPEDASRFGNAILKAAETHVNEFSEKMSADQIDALTRDVQRAEQEVSDARRQLAFVQARRGDINPQQTATAIYQLISNLELQLAETERDRNVLLEQGLTNNPTLPRLTARASELRSQIAEQKRRLANPTGGSLVRTLGEFENATAKKEISQARYESTLRILQQAYLKILEERRYFVIIVELAVDAKPRVRDVLGIAWPILTLLALILLAFWWMRGRASPHSATRLRFTEFVSRWR